jgi:pimeloyl-ACP methyl ester carboxylesterase
VTTTGELQGQTGTVAWSARAPDLEPVGVILFTPGASLDTDRYAAMLDHLASWGFAVVGADPVLNLFSPNHAGMAADAISALNAALAGPLAGVDAPVVTMGHSLGGKLAFLVANGDERVEAVFAIDPVNLQSPDLVGDGIAAALTIPVGIVGETVDATATLGMACAPEASNYATIYDAATQASAAYEWTIAGADHMDFVDDTSGCLTCAFCNDGPSDPQQTRETVRALDGDLSSWLTGDDVPAGVTVRSR